MRVKRRSLPSSHKQRLLILVGALGAFAYVAVAIATDATRLHEALLRLGITGVTGILALSAANYGLRFLRWQSYLRKLGHRLATPQHLLYYLSGFAFTVSPAKVGEAVRSVYLRNHGVSYADSLAALFAERLLDLFVMVAIAALVAFDHVEYRILSCGALILAVGVFAVVTRVTFERGLASLAQRRKSGRLKTLLAAVAELLRSSRALLVPRLLAYGTFLGLAAWGAEGLGFFWICNGLQLPVSLGTAVGIYGISVLAGTAAFMLPSGIGGMEIAMTGLLVGLGASLPSAIIATIVCRLATLWFAVILGILAASIVEIRRRRVPAIA